MTFEPGNISLVRFPRSDLKEGKNRPILLLSELPGSFDDWLICAITSQLRHEINGWDEKVSPADDDFDKSGLKQASLIRIGKLATVEENVLQGILGEISAERLERILNRLSYHLKNNIPNS
mgnify:CR=1 FL=1